MMQLNSFTATDDGIGIDPEYKETIFSPFQTFADDQRISWDGNRLGLADGLSIDIIGGSGWSPNPKKDVPSVLHSRSEETSPTLCHLDPRHRATQVNRIRGFQVAALSAR